MKGGGVEKEGRKGENKERGRETRPLN